MTENVSAIKTFVETQILSSPFVLLVVTLNLIGIALHRWKKFNNDFISPLKILAGCICYPFIADPSKIYFANNNPTFANVIIGGLVGGIAVVFHPMFVRVIAKIEQMGRKYLNGSLDKELDSHGPTPKLDQKEREQKDGN